MRALIGALALLLILAGLPGANASAGTRLAPAMPPRITVRPDGVHVSWLNGEDGTAQAAAPDWPQVTIGGLRLPAYLVALHMAGPDAPAPRVERLASLPWRGALPTAAESIIPRPASDAAPRPALAARQLAALPDTPVVVLREARLRGQRIAVVAITPLFATDGAARALTELEVLIPGAVPLVADVAQYLAAPDHFLADAPAPDNPVAVGAAWTIRVTQAGIQRLTGAALAAVGFNPGDLVGIHLRRGGLEVAIELRGSGDGRLDPTDELRFYAPTPGDRWNDADTYWLTVESTPGRRMATRNVTPGGAAPRTTAIERGVWRNNTRYDPNLPGLDGDHWYATDLRTGPGHPPAALSVPLTPTLPLAAGTTVLTITGSAYTSSGHQLQVTLGTATQTASWSGVGAWSRQLTLADTAASAGLALIPGTAPDGIEPDSIAWERPVVLNFGGRGAAFAGIAGTWRYQLANTAPDRALYDVSDPLAPILLALPGGAGPQFQDGPAPRSYLLTGPGTVYAPAVSAHVPADLAAPRSADVLYIAPGAFHAALAPLIQRRQAQGYAVAAIDVQAIYDAWSYGQVSPDAIRAFLRYTAATWPRAPLAVTLVGDGTSDPRNYSGRNNTTFIPPYLAMVDPWLGETACETCYAQLDGASPLDDALPDLVLGRLPVKSVPELSALVTKILAYETDRLGPAWRGRALFVADNYRDAAGIADSAGDFAAFADAGAALQPPGVEVQRVYYDPWKKDQAGMPLNDPWREPDANQAYARTLAALNVGAGVVVYDGHSHPWQWAVTDPAATPGSMLGLYDPDKLTNRGRLPIVIELTCLTGAFQTPAYSGTTIDERLVLAPAGAVAVWGPTGLGVAHGHDALQRGFFQALWGAPPETAGLGELTLAGYLELFTHAGCCQDALRTYALLGDPLTRARALNPERAYLPVIRR